MSWPQAANFWRIQVIVYFEDAIARRFGELMKNRSYRIPLEESLLCLINSAQIEHLPCNEVALFAEVKIDGVYYIADFAHAT